VRAGARAECARAQLTSPALDSALHSDLLLRRSRACISKAAWIRR
jgi:hypothetical protein